MPVLRVSYELGAHSQSTLFPYPEVPGGRGGSSSPRQSSGHVAVGWVVLVCTAGHPLHELNVCVSPTLPAMQETQVRSLGWEDPLEKRMANLSSTLAWKIPWTEESGGLQSMGHKELNITGLSD